MSSYATSGAAVPRFIHADALAENKRLARLLSTLSGPLAERLALDMDHKCKDHAKWYRAVKRARAILAARKEAP